MAAWLQDVLTPEQRSSLGESDEADNKGGNVVLAAGAGKRAAPPPPALPFMLVSRLLKWRARAAETEGELAENWVAVRPEAKPASRAARAL